MKKSLTKKLAHGRSIGITGTSCKIFVPFSFSSYGNEKFSLGHVTFWIDKTRGTETLRPVGGCSIPSSWFVDLSLDVEEYVA